MQFGWLPATKPAKASLTRSKFSLGVAVLPNKVSFGAFLRAWGQQKTGKLLSLASIPNDHFPKPSSA
jgi:hypothetical protein